MDALSDGWQIVKADLGTWVGITLVVIAIGIAVSVPGAVYRYWRVGFNQSGPDSLVYPADVVLAEVLLGALSSAIAYLVLGGVLHFALRRLRGDYPSFGDIFQFGGNAGRLFAAGLILAIPGVLPVVIGQVAMATYRTSSTDMLTLSFIGLAGELIGALILVAIVVLAIFTPLLIIDREIGPFDALKESFKTAGPQFFPIFGLLFVVGLVGLLGACACGVGLLITLPIGYATQAALYNDFFRPAQPEAPMVPPPHLLNPPPSGSL